MVEKTHGYRRLVTLESLMSYDLEFSNLYWAINLYVWLYSINHIGKFLKLMPKNKFAPHFFDPFLNLVHQT